MSSTRPQVALALLAAALLAWMLMGEGDAELGRSIVVPAPNVLVPPPPSDGDTAELAPAAAQSGSTGERAANRTTGNTAEPKAALRDELRAFTERERRGPDGERLPETIPVTISLYVTSAVDADARSVDPASAVIEVVRTPTTLSSPVQIGETKLFRFEFEVPNPEGQRGRRGRSTPQPELLLVTVDHPNYARYEEPVPISQAEHYIDPEDHRVGYLYRINVALRPIYARLRGPAPGATSAVLVEYDNLRPADRWKQADHCTVRGGRYDLRVPSSGDWLVVALRDEAHPYYAIVDVSPGQTFIEVPARLAPFHTELSVRGRAPTDFDPSGLGVTAVAYDPKDRVALDGKPRSDRPRLGWRPTAAAPPGPDGFGLDLRGGRTEPLERDAVVWRAVRAEFGATGLATLKGLPTSKIELYVERPFAPRITEVEPAFVPGREHVVDLKVARIDVTASAEHGALVGPMPGGTALATARIAHRSPLGAFDSGEWQTADVERNAALDEEGRGVLFVPSDAPVHLSARSTKGALAQLAKPITLGANTQTSIYLPAAAAAVDEPAKVLTEEQEQRLRELRDAATPAEGAGPRTGPRRGRRSDGR